MTSNKLQAHYNALGFLARHAGYARVAGLAVLTFASSLTEGIGLLMLVPVTLVLSGQSAPETLSSWLQPLAQLPPSLLLGTIVFLVGLRAVIVYISNEKRRTLALSLSRRLRTQTHQAILRANWRWLSQQNSADHAALIMGETVRAGSLVDHALSLITSTISIAVFLLAGALLSPTLTAIMIVAGIVLGLPLLIIRASTSANAQAYSDVYGELQGLVSNGLSHLRGARIANATHVLERDFARYSALLQQHEQHYYRATYRAQAIFQIAVAGCLAVAVYAALFWAEVALVVFVPLLAIAIRSAAMLLRVQQALHQWRYDVTALDQLRQLIDMAKANAEPAADRGEAIEFKKELVLDHVTFAYPGRDGPVFTDLSYRITHGEIVAVHGASGAGKSTLADLVCGLLAPDKGGLVIDERRLDAGQIIQWRSQTAYVEQAGFFFEGTIGDNVRWGLETASDDDVRTALKAALAHFVFELPEGLDSQMGEGGRQFSGGEKQRIALARALLHQPDLLILDEVTSGLDAQSKDGVHQSLEALKGQYTVLLLSHDPAMLAIAERTIDLDAL